MEIVLLLARLLLASVFVVAGAAKVVDREGSRRAIADFGVPAPLTTPLGLLLPLAELVVAAALIPASTAWWGAAGALALLLVFVAGIGANLARGRKPECRCFGQLHSEPAGWNTLARNGFLAAVAGFVLWQGYGGAGPSAVGWLASLSATQVAGLVLGLAVLGVLAAQWWLLLNLLRQNGRLLMRVDALEWRLGAGGVAARRRWCGAISQRRGGPIAARAPDRGYGSGVRASWPPRGDAHAKVLAHRWKAGDAAIHRPGLWSLHGDAARDTPLAEGARRGVNHLASEPGHRPGEPR
jgi:uncharacterized membrane protein YphA (DoxX/SURF4 family)